LKEIWNIWIYELKIYTNRIELVVGRSEMLPKAEPKKSANRVEYSPPPAP
jgi:hypothetical protein